MLSKKVEILGTRINLHENLRSWIANKNNFKIGFFANREKRRRKWRGIPQDISLVKMAEQIIKYFFGVSGITTVLIVIRKFIINQTFDLGLEKYKQTNTAATTIYAAHFGL